MGATMTVQEQNAAMVSKIRDLCESVGISIKALEEALAFPNGTIGKWANAKKPAPFDRVAQVAEYFGVSVPFLRGEGGMPNEGSGLSSNAMVAALLFDQSEEWVQEQVLSFLRAALEHGGRK